MNLYDQSQLEKIAANYQKPYKEVKQLFDYYVELGMENPGFTYNQIRDDSLERINDQYQLERNKCSD